MRNPRNVILGAFLSAFIMLFSGCPTPFNPIGAALAVDDNGHFTADVEYHQGSAVYKYNADGSYEETYQGYEPTGYDYNGNGVTGEGWVQSGGSRGTYNYVPGTYTFTETETSYFYGTQWYTYRSSESWVLTKLVSFADHQIGDVYTASGSSWVHTYSWTYSNTAVPSYGYTDDYTTTLSLTEGTGGFVYSYAGVETPNGGTAFTFSVVNMVGDLEFLPAGTTLADGNTVTCNIRLATRTQQTYDWTNLVLNPAINLSVYYTTWTFTCQNGCLISYPGSMERGIERAATRGGDRQTP